MRGAGRLILASILLVSSLAGARAEESKAEITPTEAEAIFLDRLMIAESSGRQFAKNPASSALGPFQFLGTTFLDVVRRNFPGVALGKNEAQILALRTDFMIARNVALIYTRENAEALAASGHEATPRNLRLAFFAGASGAVKVLAADPEEPVSRLLSEAAIAANPFLRGMTASELLARADRDAAGLGEIVVALQPRPSRGLSGISVHCKLGLASCRHWLALAEKRLAVKARFEPKN